MPLNVDKIVITDEMTLLAKTAQVSLKNSTRLPAPANELIFSSEASHLTATDLRPDGRFVTIDLASSGNPTHTVFTGKVEYVDDITTANKDEGRIDMSALPTQRNYLKRISAVVSSVPSAAGALNASNQSVLPSAKALVRQLAKAVSMQVGMLDFPDYAIVGSYPIEFETIIEATNRIIAPFNIFKFQRHVVKVDNNVLSVVKYDFTKEGLTVLNPFVLTNIISTSRVFQEFVPEPVIGDSSVVLTGAMRPEGIQMHPVPIDHPKVPQMNNPDDWSEGANEAAFALTTLIQEKKITDTITSESTDKTGNYANPAYDVSASNDPAGTPSNVGVTHETTTLTHLLLTGYDATLPDKLSSAVNIATNLESYVKFLSTASQGELIAFMALEFGALSDEQLLQLAGERFGRVSSAAKQFQSIVDQLEQAFLTSLADTVPGESISNPEERLSSIPADQVNIVPIYGSIDPTTGEPTVIDVEEKPSVAYGDVIYVQSLTVLAAVPLKIHVMQRAASDGQTTQELKEESFTYNDFKIRKYQADRRLIHTGESTESYVYDSGVKIPEEKTTSIFVYDDTGDLVQTTISKFKNFRGEWMLYKIDIEMDAKTTADYVLQTFEDGKRRISPALTEYQLLKTRNDIREGFENGLSNFTLSQIQKGSDYNVIAKFESTRVPMGHYVLRNGEPFDETTAQLDFLFSQGLEATGNKFISGLYGSLVGVGPATLFKLNFPNMNYDGLKLVWNLCKTQIELEKKNAYWEIATHAAILDTTPTSGIVAVAAGSSGVVDYVQHEIDADKALSTIRTVKINETLPPPAAQVL